jgi:hypothetical protein
LKTGPDPFDAAQPILTRRRGDAEKFEEERGEERRGEENRREKKSSSSSLSSPLFFF